MKSRYPLFKGHLDFAHLFWKNLITNEDLVIDMTAGNGHDTLFLSTLKPKKLIAIDIQPQAVDNTKSLVGDLAEVFLKNHADFPLELAHESVKLAVYNLGWLPGGDKNVTTLIEGTLKSLHNLLPKINLGGAISITCYPGHPQGAEEETILLVEFQKLDPKEWSVTQHRWLNRQKSPSLLLLQKRL